MVEATIYVKPTNYSVSRSGSRLSSLPKYNAFICYRVCDRGVIGGATTTSLNSRATTTTTSCIASIGSGIGSTISRCITSWVIEL
jgi:hypothetical protein